MSTTPTLEDLLPAGFVAPDYAGGSLANLPPAFGRMLGVSAPWRAAPAAALDGVDDARHVILLLLDGLGQHVLEPMFAREPGPLGRLIARYGAHAGDGLPRPITSIAPSTTTAATSVLQGDGRTAGGLGIVSYTQLLAELGVVANMLFFRPAYSESARTGELEAWGVRPEELFAPPTVYQLLGRAGVTARALLPGGLSTKPLSRMQLQGARTDEFVGWVDMLDQLFAALGADAGGRSYTYAYLDDFDALMHRDGPASRTVPALYEALTAELERRIEGLSVRARAGTVIVITADHGHVATPPEKRRFILDYPALLEEMVVREAGEPRHVHLYARAGRLGALVAAAEGLLGDEFLVLRGADALAAGLYGDPRTLHPQAARRVGDVVLLARGEASLWPDPEKRQLLGMHGALEPAEMLVPLVTLRLDT